MVTFGFSAFLFVMKYWKRFTQAAKFFRKPASEMILVFAWSSDEILIPVVRYLIMVVLACSLRPFRKACWSL